MSQPQVGISADPPTPLGTSAGRIAILEKRVDDDEETLVRYVYSNHLQSALELDEEAENISYEEYHPYSNKYKLVTSYSSSASTKIP